MTPFPKSGFGLHRLVHFPPSLLLRGNQKFSGGRVVRYVFSNPKCSKSRDLIAIAICDSNRESQITSDLRVWAGWVRPPPRGARRKPLCEFPCWVGCLRCCARCLRYLYGMLYVSPCLVCLSQLGYRRKEWAKRRNALLGRKLALRMVFVFASRGRFPERGVHQNSRCSGPLG